jgi:hypothetical protein
MQVFLDLTVVSSSYRVPLHLLCELFIHINKMILQKIYIKQLLYIKFAFLFSALQLNDFIVP